MIKAISVLLLLIVVLKTFASNIDTNYIGYYPFKGTLYSYIINKNNRLEYHHIEKNYYLHYLPNSWGSFGFGGSYRWFDLSLGIASFGKKDESIYGKTTKLDIQSHIYLRSYMIDLFLQSYKSFYSESYYITNDSQKVYLRPDIGLTQIGGSLYRILKSDKFSPKAAFSASEIQKRSAGTWVLGGKINIFGLLSDSSFTSTLLDTIFKSDFRFNSFVALMIGLQGGYLHNFKLKNWILHISFMAGLANQMQNKKLSSQPDKNYVHTTTGITINFRFATTYSKNRYYFILAAISDDYKYPLSNQIRLSHQFGRIDIVVGYRLFNNSKTNQQVLNL